MYSHPDTIYSVATEVQRQYQADADQRRLLAGARRRRSRRSRWSIRHRQ